MAHQAKIPPVKLTLDKDLFNQLVNILDYNNKLNVDTENFSSIANKLKEKLLKYSVPRMDDDNVEFVNIRFFINEASDIIWQLLLRVEKNEIVDDYYSMLINNRQSE